MGFTTTLQNLGFPVKLRDDLTAWLKAIRDGVAESDVLAKAQEALRTEEALPEDVRLSGLQDDPQAGAAALLSLGGLDDTFSALLRSAVAIESGEHPFVGVHGIAIDPVHTTLHPTVFGA